MTLAQYEQVYRLLDRRAPRAEACATASTSWAATCSGRRVGQSQAEWFTYLANHMGDLLDAWSVHVYWEFWDAAKIDRRLEAEVRTIFSVIPAEQRRPLFVTEFGVRGVPTFEGEPASSRAGGRTGRGCRDDAAAFQQAWFMIRAAQLGFTGTVKWDLYPAKYDAGTQDHSALGPGARGLAGATRLPRAAAHDD